MKDKFFTFVYAIYDNADDIVYKILVWSMFIFSWVAIIFAVNVILSEPNSLSKACEGEPYHKVASEADKNSTLLSEKFILNTETLDGKSVKVVSAEPTFQPITSEDQKIDASSCPTSPQYVGDRYEFSYVDDVGEKVSVTVAKELVDIELLNEGETPTVEATTTVFDYKEQYGKAFKQHNGDESKVEFTRYFVRL